MGIRQGYIDENTKEFKMNMQMKTFADVGYWLRDIKKKLKKFEILKINVTINVAYFDDGYREDEE